MNELRLFTAVRPTAAAIAEMERVRDDLRAAIGSDAVRWIERENFHITLHFLGATPEDRVVALTEAMTSTAAGITRFVLATGRAGAFPGPRRAKTIWVGIDDPDGVLGGLERSLREHLRNHDFVPDTKQFRPHVTVGYVRRRAQATDSARIATALRLVNPRPLRFTVTGILLVRSTLGPGGSRYEDIGSAALQ